MTMTRSGSGPLSAVAALVAAIVLAACGGGGSSDNETTPAQTLGPAASTVVSTDGKVSVAVGDNALQAPVAISIVPATPDAALAADPALVPGTTYDYTAPALQVPEKVLITIESPLAVSPASAAPGRMRAMALPPGYFPPPTCLVNAPGFPPVQNIYVTGPDCPQSPAPACVKVYSAPTDPLTDLFGNPLPQPGNPQSDSLTLCAPAEDVIAIPGSEPCPAGYREVTGEPAFAALAAQHALSKICQRLPKTPPPTLTHNGGPTSVPCTPRDGKFVCVVDRLPSGRLSVVWDREPPYPPVLDGQSPIPLPVPETGAPAMLTFNVSAKDQSGLGGVELIEITNLNATPSVFGEGVSVLPSVKVWSAPSAQFHQATPVKDFNATVTVPYSLSDPPVRAFFLRSYDRSGNSSSSPPYPAKSVVDGITIVGFVQGDLFLGEGNLGPAVGWAVKGATAINIEPGVGNFTSSGSLTVADEGVAGILPVPGTTFTLTATHPTRATKTATVVYGFDTTPPVVTLAASPSGLFAPGSTTLTAIASDAVGVTKVEFLRGTTLIGTDMAAPYTQTVAFTVADAGTVSFTAKAYDAAGNVTTSAVANVAVGVVDTTPPTVSLVASPSTLVAPGIATLQATAADAGGIARVEFYRGATLLQTATSPPYQTTVSLTAADVGSVSFTARAIDAQQNSTVSAPAIVVVSASSAQDTYASPTGVDAGNTTCAQANPCRSIAQAAAAAGANKTVWLNNGVYDGTTQPVPIQIPAGLTLRALTPSLAGVGQQIVLQGSATVVGVVLRRNNIGDFGSIAASAGTVTLDGVKAVGSSAIGSGFSAPLALSGSVHATMTPGNIADYADQLSAAGQSVAIYGMLSGSSRLTVNGGTFGGAALGGADALGGAYNRGAFNLTGSSRLDLNNVVLNVDSSGIFLYGEATQLHMSGSTLHANANTGPGYGIYAAKGTPLITLVNSVISGFDYASVGLYVGTFGQPGVQATVTATNTVFTANNLGMFVLNGGTPSPSLLTLTGSNVGVIDNTHGGIVCRDACNVDLVGGELSHNATDSTVDKGFAFHGGLWMGTPTQTYQLKLRNMLIVDNKSNIGFGNSIVSDNSGVTMAGNAASAFDLGTGPSPGNNLIAGNTSSAQTAGLNVAVAPGVTVRAVGNTFAPNVQGANAQGKYQLGAAPCGASNCDVTGGSGANYRLTSGVLRLAQ